MNNLNINLSIKLAHKVKPIKLALTEEPNKAKKKLTNDEFLTNIVYDINRKLYAQGKTIQVTEDFFTPFYEYAKDDTSTKKQLTEISKTKTDIIKLIIKMTKIGFNIQQISTIMSDSYDRIQNNIKLLNDDGVNQLQQLKNLGISCYNMTNHIKEYAHSEDRTLNDAIKGCKLALDLLNLHAVVSNKNINGTVNIFDKIFPPKDEFIKDFPDIFYISITVNSPANYDDNIIAHNVNSNDNNDNLDKDSFVNETFLEDNFHKKYI